MSHLFRYDEKKRVDFEIIRKKKLKIIFRSRHQINTAIVHWEQVSTVSELLFNIPKSLLVSQLVNNEPNNNENN